MMVTPKKYKKKPVEIEAMQFVGSPKDAFDVVDWIKENDYPWLVGDASDPDSLRIRGEKGRPTRGIWINPDGGCLMIRTLDVDMKVSQGDYVIKGAEGVFYPCKPDVFEQTYVLADGEWNEFLVWRIHQTKQSRKTCKG